MNAGTKLAVVLGVMVAMAGCAPVGEDGTAQTAPEIELTNSYPGVTVTTHLTAAHDLVAEVRGAESHVVLLSVNTPAAEYEQRWQAMSLPAIASDEASAQRAELLEAHNNFAYIQWAHTQPLNKEAGYCDSYTNYCAAYCDSLMCTTCCTSYSPCYRGSTVLARLFGC